MKIHDIPTGDVAVTVRLINPVNFGPAIIKRFMAPPVPGLEKWKASPSLSFLLEHPSGRRLVWDLGIRKDYENYAPSIAKYIPTTGYKFDGLRNVADIMTENNVELSSIEAVIWSHWHWDHIGNPGSFPSSTNLVVGRGFKKAMLPGAPANPDSPIQESDYEGRTLREIEFEGAQTLKIGQFDAFDYFGDGSLYLLDTPGHAVGHLSALVRTTVGDKSTFVLLGGDVCHYTGILRPSAHLPVPSHILPHPCCGHPDVDDAKAQAGFCPGTAFDELQQDRGRKPTDTLYDLTFGLDVQLATKTVGKLQELDCDENVFVIIAHDRFVRDVVPHFPASINDWHAKGWGEQVRWAFLGDLEVYWKSRGLFTPHFAMADSKSTPASTGTNTNTGHTGSGPISTAGGHHENAGAEALRKAYAKYNVHPTISNPAAVRHNAAQADKDKDGKVVEDGAKDAKETGGEK